MTVYEKFCQLSDEYKDFSIFYVENEIEYYYETDILESFKNIEYETCNGSFFTRELLLCDSRGIYIPRDFTDFTGWAGISKEDKEILSNPDNLDYWETWESVLNNAYFEHKESGLKFELEQDGDLWAVHYFE